MSEETNLSKLIRKSDEDFDDWDVSCDVNNEGVVQKVNRQVDESSKPLRSHVLLALKYQMQEFLNKWSTYDDFKR